MKPWLILLVAIAAEVCGTTCMKLSQGFTKPLPSVLIFVFYGLSFAALTYTLKWMEISVVYAVWSGVGVAAISLIGILWFKDSVTAWKIICLLLIFVGVIGLRWSGASVRE